MFLSRRRRALLGGVSWAFATNFNDQAWGFDFQNGRGFLPTLGSELVTNGTFDTDLTGWTVNAPATQSWVNGALRITNGGASGGTQKTSYRTIATVPGRLYQVTADVLAGGTVGGFINVDPTNTAAAGSGTVSSGSVTGPASIKFYFTATATSHYVAPGASGTTLGQYVDFDNVSVREVQLFSYGGELVSNGDFATDLSGWTPFLNGGTGTAVWSSGAAAITGDGTNATGIRQSFTTVAGQRYAFSAIVGGNALTITAATTLGGNDLALFGAFQPGVLNGTFVATTTTTWVEAYRVGAVTGTLDNVSVRPISIGPRQSAQFTDVFAYTATGTTSRTYVDAAGVLRDMSYDRTNLCFYSQDVDNAAWTKIRTTATANVATAPDGTLTADKLVEDTSSASFTHYIQNVITAVAGQPYTMSMYVKAAELTRAGISCTGGGLADTAGDFDLTTGAFVSAPFGVNNGATYGAVSAGNGWWRLWLTVTPLTSSAFAIRLYLSNGGITYTGADGTKGVYVWGGQLEFGTALTGYKPTQNVQVTNGVNAPRYDYSNGKQQLLLENAATNSIRNNTMVGAVAGTPGTTPTNWVLASAPTGVTRTVIGTGVFNGIDYIDINYAGTLTASGGINVSFETATQIAALTGQTWTGSVYAQVLKDIGGVAAAAGIRQQITERDGAGGLLTSNTGTTDITTTWARNVQTQTLANASTAFLFNRVVTVANIASGATIDFTIRIGLPQLEQSSFASSPIRTTGTAVTRPIETARFSPLVEAILGRSSAGVVARVGKAQNADVSTSTMRIVGGASGQYIRKTTGSWNVTAQSEAGSSLATTAGIVNFATTPVGAAMGFDPAGRSLTINGTTPVSDANVQGAPAAAYLGRDTPAGNYGNGWYDYVGGQAYRPSNAQLQNLSVGAPDYAFAGSMLDMNFLTGQYWGATPSAITTTRSTTGYAQQSDGTWVNFAANTPRLTDLGLLVEEGRTNSIRNNTVQGLVSGSPGTTPTNWFISLPGGLTRTLTPGTVNGVEGVFVEYSGVLASTGPLTFIFESATSGSAAAAPGQTWTNSSFLQLVSGTLPGPLGVVISENNSSGTFLAGSNTNTNPTATLTRFSHSRTVINTSTAFVGPYLQIPTVNSGTTVAFKLFIGWPQLENNGGIPGTVSAATVASGGTGYAVNDTITLTGGTFTTAAVLTVTSVSAGVITGVSVSNAGVYSSGPTGTVAQGSTSGVGTGATFNLTWLDKSTQGFPTSPIRTTGSAVARNPDVCVVDLAALGVGLSTAATLFGQGQFAAPVTVSNINQTLVQIDAGSAAERLNLYRAAVTGVPVSLVATGNSPVFQPSYATAIAQNTRYKGAIAGSASDYAFTANAQTPITQASGAFPSAPTKLRLCYNAGSPNGVVLLERVALFPSRVSNATIQSITS